MRGRTIAGERSAARNRQRRACKRGAITHAAGAANEITTTTVGIDIASSPRNAGNVRSTNNLQKRLIVTSRCNARRISHDGSPFCSLFTALKFFEVFFLLFGRTST
jgi:hypothetical protein